MSDNWAQLEYGMITKSIQEEHAKNDNNEFIRAIIDGNVEYFFECIEKGADVNCVLEGETPLLVAMNQNNVDLFSLLINLNANVNYEFDDGYSIVWKTLWQQKNDFLNLLVKKINKNTKEKKTGKTILMEAVRYSNLNAVKAIVLSGFNINMKDNKGNTALHYALSKDNMNENDVEIVKFLIASGADVLSKNVNGNTPEDVIKSDIQEPQEPKVTNGQKQKVPKNNYSNKKNPKYTPK